MLFLLTKPSTTQFETIKQMAGDEDKQLLLTSDAVYLARESMEELVEKFDFEEVFADEKCVTDRGVKVFDDCQVVNMEKIVDLVTQNGKLINL